MKTTTAAVALLLVGGVIACGSGGPTPGLANTVGPAPNPTPGPARRLLVVTHTAGFRHDSIPTAEATLQEIGARSGLYEIQFCRNADDVKRLMSRDSLTSFDAVFFANTTGNLGIPDLPAFLQWIANGGGFLGAHSASDTYHESAAFIEMLGGEFKTHGSIVPTEVRVDDPSHPTVAHLAPSFTITDELYRFDRFSATNIRLLTIDTNPADGVGEAGAPADLPMAWHRTLGQGRVFYTAFGHRAEVWQDSRFQQHVREAIRWVLRL